jgi:hypothetical protein
MGGGSTSQPCAHCGSELQAGTRFCRICGQSVLGNDAEPVPFPDLPAESPSGATLSPDRPESGSLNLPGGGLHPRDTAQDTVTAAAIPAIRHTPRPAPPADDQPAGYQPPGYQPPGYRPPEYQSPEYQRADQQATRYQPPGYQPAGHQPPGYQPPGYQPAGHQPPGYQPPGYQPAGNQLPGFQPAGYQPGGYQPPGSQPPGYQSADHQPPGYQPPGYQPPPGGGGSRRIIVGVLAVIVAVGGVAAGLLIAQAHTSSGHLAGQGHSTPAQSSGSPGTGSPGSVSPSSATASAQQQGADNLSALLASSVSDRGAINDAYNDVQSCGPTLAQDQATFQQAVTSRQSLLSRLGSMPDAAALPAGMISSLTQAWQASITADQDFAAWAQDESASCTPNGSDANLSAATGPDNQATQDKTAFVASWNPIAQQYRLPTYSQGQL